MRLSLSPNTYKTCQPENNDFEGATCTAAVNLPAHTKDKCFKLVKPSTDEWRCCQYWDGKYHW